MTREVTPLGQALVKAGLITEEQLRIALNEQAKTGKLLGEVLEELKFVEPVEVMQVLTTQGGIPYISLRNTLVEVELFDQFPVQLLMNLETLPLWKLQRTLTLASSQPTNWVALDRFRQMVNEDVFAYSADRSEIRNLIQMLAKEPLTRAQPEPGWERVPGPAPPPQVPQKPALRLIFEILTSAIKKQAEEIHIELDGSHLVIRFRVAGKMERYRLLNRSQYPALIAELSEFCRLPSGSQRIETGGVRVTYLGREYDLKVTVLPTIEGEKMIIRPISREYALLDLDELGMAEEDLRVVKEAIGSEVPGMMIVAGPPVSGRTTTLYSLLLALNSPTKNVATLEREVEIHLPHITQYSVASHDATEHTRMLRMLTQHPHDILMVSEAQTEEDFRSLVRAVLNGMKVLAGVTARDIADALIQIVALGVDPYWLARTISFIVAQRLVRRVCASCKKPYVLDAQTAESLGISGGPWEFYKADGCKECSFTGYHGGETALFEILVFNEEVRKGFERKPDYAKVSEIVARHTQHSLLSDGLAKASAGITTLEEVIRVLK
ncbi:MAG: GspE/PulE family protein [bacterium JZ-2024 1]